MTLEANKLYAQLRVCMSQVGSKNPLNLTQPIWGFLTQPTIVGKKKNSTQSNPSHKSNPTHPNPTHMGRVELMGWTKLLYLLLLLLLLLIN